MGANAGGGKNMAVRDTSSQARKSVLMRNKKGLFYIIVSSMLVIVFIVIFLAYKQYSLADRQRVTETRIRTINDFIRDIESDSPRVIFISGFRSLIAVEDYVARKGHYLNDSEELFRVAFYNGTVNNTAVDVLVNSTYSDYLRKLKEIAGRIGIDIDINVTRIELFQQSPWSVTVNVTALISLTDRKGLARWGFNKTYSANVSILSIRDPVYSVATRGLVPNAINISSITDLDNGFVGPSNDTTSLSTHVNYSYYVHNSQAPSFLMRLEGNFNSSECCGIESFIYMPRLSEQGFTVNSSRSIIDYIYFSNDSIITAHYDATACNVKNMQSWFIIDTRHINPLAGQPDYIENLNYTICP